MLMGRRMGPPGMPTGPIERAQDARGVVLRLWGYLRRQRALLIATAFMVTVNSLLTLAGPYLMAKAIDQYILPGDLPGLWRLGGLMLVVYAANSLFSWLQSYIMAGAAQRTVRDLRDDLFAKIQTFSLRFFDQRTHGDLMSRMLGG